MMAFVLDLEDCIARRMQSTAEQGTSCPAKAERSWQCFVLNPQGLDICLKSFALTTLQIHAPPWLETGPCCLLLRVCVCVYVTARVCVFVPHIFALCVCCCMCVFCVCVTGSINSNIRQCCCLLHCLSVFVQFPFMGQTLLSKVKHSKHPLDKWKHPNQ